MIDKLLIANRGEIAVRIIRTCKNIGIKTVAIYSEADKDSMYVKMADEAYCVGPAKSELSYLNMQAIITLAIFTGCSAIHPGYGFLSENADFAEKVENASENAQSNLVFIGPKYQAIRLLGQKAVAKDIMRKAGVPVIPGSESTISSPEEGKKIADSIGYPVLIKATSGGGGKGMRLVESPDDFIELCRTAQTEASIAFGDGRVYIEKYMQNPRHIEVQIASDVLGRVFALGVRECSIQRRHQKLLEESSSVALTPELKLRIEEAALKAIRAVNNGKDGIIYRGLGTVEFLLNQDGSFYFMEVNTRLQVEHPVTEVTCGGQDLVALQIWDAMNEPFEMENEILENNGWAIECRINAEDPENNFMPSPGVITKLRLPGGPYVRVDTCVYEGYQIPSCYDTLIAKLIVWGRDRDEAISRMTTALSEFKIEGIANTISFQQYILNSNDFYSGKFSTDFVEKHYDDYLRMMKNKKNKED